MTDRPSSAPWIDRWAWALAAAPLLLFVPVLWGEVLLFKDLFIHAIPLHAYGASALAQGRLPEWNPLLAGGIPFLADLQAAVFYPAQLLYLSMTPERAATAFVLLHAPIAAAGTHALSRVLGASPRFAALAGVGFATSGYVLALHSNSNYFSAAALLPGVVAALLHLADGPSARRLALGSAMVCLLCLNGEPQTLAEAAVMALALGAAGERPGRALAWIASGLGLGAALAAVQLVPALAFLSGTERGGGLGLESSGTLALHPVRWLQFLVPAPFGMPFPEFGYWGSRWVNFAGGVPWSESLFLGPAFLLPALAQRPQTRRLLVLALVTLVALALSAGPFLPFFRWWHSLVPLAGSFRYPEKFSLVTTLGAVLLSVAALERPGFGKGRGPWLAFGAGALLLALVIAALVRPEASLALVQEGLASGTPIAADEALARSLTSLGWSALLCGLFGFALRATPRTGPVLLALGVLPSLWFGAGTLSFGKSPSLREPPPALAWVRDAPKAGTGRVIRDESCPLPVGGPGTGLERAVRWRVETGVGDVPMLWNVPLDWGYVGVPLKDPREVRDRVGAGPGGAQRWAQVAGAEFRLGCGADGRPGIARLNRPRARAAVLPARQETRERQLELLADPAFVVGEVALVEDATTIPVPTGPSTTIVEDLSAEQVRVRVEGGGGLLVLADVLAPGWTATLDGRPEPILRVDRMWRGVPVSPGAHEVVFRYRTPGLGAGAWASGLALLGCMGLVVGGRRRR